MIDLLSLAFLTTSWNKKGISPIIATLIVVAISISLAAFIMRFVGGYVQNVTEETEDYGTKLSCSTEIFVDIISACYDENRINFILANKRSKKIENDNFYLRIFHATMIDLQPFKIDGLKEGEIKNALAHYRTEYGAPKKISLIPALKSPKKEILCLDNAKEIPLTLCPAKVS